MQYQDLRRTKKTYLYTVASWITQYPGEKKKALLPLCGNGYIHRFHSSPQNSGISFSRNEWLSSSITTIIKCIRRCPISLFACIPICNHRRSYALMPRVRATTYKTIGTRVRRAQELQDLQLRTDFSNVATL